MNADNIFGNLVASLIWCLLAFAAIKFRGRFKSEMAKRKATAQALAAMYSETDANFETVRPDFILMVELAMESSRRLLLEDLFLTLACWVNFVSTAFSTELHPSEPKRWILVAINLIPLCACGYYAVMTSHQLRLFEESIINGLRKRIDGKVKTFGKTSPTRILPNE